MRTDGYGRLIELLDRAGARYRVIDHPPEGRTDAASALRGHRLDAAAKCMVVRVGLGSRSRQYLLTVVPGDRQIDMEQIRRLYRGTDAALASREKAEDLTGCRCGSIVPFSFDPTLPLYTDPALLRHPEIYFNAACLDHSVALSTQDYLDIARPHLLPLTRG
ncbi:hypothetical protein GCM10018785_24270 [Streptomyces longispororuber]|uniref:YbaK/aminoacyl-tRNA synthetase-associated domain-containing protein n=1 Tax=Streptomyces longispororuber TaxID=68230 RepID=A0A919DKJ9_9ACTN|nr:hypothetical protein GCM10018785_24270 [Streptomyces longispororuber]